FQEMVAQFSRDPYNPGTWSTPNPKAYTESEIGIDFLAERINNMTAFLHQKYNKPVFLPYMTVATATWDDTNVNGQIDSNEVDLEGWEEKASQTYQDMLDLRGELQSNGLFGYAPMALFDDPAHDKGGYQYFMNNEYHLGVSKTNAQDGVHTRLLGDLSPKSNILNFIY
ncbi:MAG: Endo-1,4-beta-xylanase A, partial [uncultured Sulfurovum sp.]